MNPQKSPLVDHPPQQHLQPLLPHHHQHQQPPPQGHGTLAPAVHGHGIMAQPLNPPPQPHQQEKPNSYILPNSSNNDFVRAKVIFHQPQQQNLQSPLNSVSGQHQKFNLHHSDGPTIAGISAEPAKKKRGRPRKYSADGSIGLDTTPTSVAQIHSTANPVNSGVAGPNDVASSENPSKKGHGRPSGSRKQKKQRETLVPMNPQKSPLVDHPPQQHLQPLLPHHHQHQQPPPQGHGTLAPAVHGHGIMAQPLNPPPQPHQLNSYILPNSNNNDFVRAKVIFHQPQQQNLQSPLNSVSGQHQKFNLHHSDGPTIAGISAEPAKKKRGRPRKYSADCSIGLCTTPTPVAQSHSTANPVNPGIAGPNDVASSENPSKKGHGRPPGSRKQKQQRETLGDVAFGFMHHLINVNIGEDIASKLMTFLKQTPRPVCILSAIGVVCKVTLLQFAGGGTVTYKGRFVITSLSGSFLLSESNGSHRRIGGLAVSLVMPDGKVFGGVIAGTLMAATPVQVNVVSFVEKEEKPNSEAPSLTPPDSVTETSSPSPGAANNLAIQPMHGILGQTM